MKFRQLFNSESAALVGATLFGAGVAVVNASVALGVADASEPMRMLNAFYAAANIAMAGGGVYALSDIARERRASLQREI